MKSLYLYALVSSVGGFFSFCLNRKHFLSLLLSLEFLMISLYFLMIQCFMMNEFSVFFMLLYLTISVCEGVLGLSIMVVLVRSMGNDFLMSFSSLW
uniref:NADH-ubiquinone oxidoreductase chain 4L n=1 Tax=Brontispa longissima TaxID=111217 RepID=A0A7T8V7S1_BROLO|nr:NADH dehydrogenase subunit 4L [Brontispa longissima]QQQ89059.1 NADH dehydrogenase subunit 4L [Brontispa longissima]UAJ48110.1 NADH dehydrogenase subunit 4L [Brontispa longissima]URQ17585.1 NADH dehydrogenase subunit 4L [Brontispa longissima]